MTPEFCSAWTTVDDLPCTTADAAVAAQAVEVASELLYVLSGRQFPGVCESTVRPVGYCMTPLGASIAMRTYARLAGAGISVRALDTNGCCGRISEVGLGAVPILAVSEVLVDGVVVDPGAYAVDSGSTLVRLDGDAWPCCPRLDLATSEVGTFEVTFTHGQAPPASGVAAANALACEIAGALSGAADCAIPERVTSLARQGVSMTLRDAQSALDENGGVGLELVDYFLRAYNPGNHRQPRPRVTNPDRVAGVRRLV